VLIFTNLNVERSVKPELLNRNKSLASQMFSEFHGKATRCHTLFASKLSRMHAASRFHQKQHLVIRLCKLEQVRFGVDVINILKTQIDNLFLVINFLGNCEPFDANQPRVRERLVQKCVVSASFYFGRLREPRLLFSMEGGANA
jgi:hypothetical protein